MIGCGSVPGSALKSRVAGRKIIERRGVGGCLWRWVRVRRPAALEADRRSLIKTLGEPGERAGYSGPAGEEAGNKKRYVRDNLRLTRLLG